MIISVNQLTKRFGHKAVLRGLNFEVSDGEFVALIGPNGAGKTTFLRILASLVRPSAGKVRVAGYVLPPQAAAVRQRLGMVSHQPLLYDDLTAAENLRFYGRMYGVNLLDKRIEQALDCVGLASRKNDLVRTFSRGMQQRLAIGRATLHNPDILLLDEPHTGLDQDACEMLDAVLRQVSGEKRTIVMTSHDLARVADLATRFDVLARGRICASTLKENLPPQGLLAFYKEALKP